ncbi:unnamed protein product [Dovyalis caffra]|uniref:Uncharacterized protein n=1 Tax=Dovyalis caffra TaxID=77055 RepID=A0AAV1SQC0_9ROSI|nr:unnamed protein product [Dovyalis caffra]
MKPTNPISIEHPQGRSSSIEDGHIVKWAYWEFHPKADLRVGIVISLAMVSETNETRRHLEGTKKQREDGHT